jgi:EAL domain-containing protein (putative c-di-GMP-specific phosphodiesterase class I)/DNA-binding NarL/FixJ family response regulator
MDAHSNTAYSALTVLVVEDHDFQRRVARNTLQQLEVTRVLEAVDGHAALAELRGSTTPVDVVLCDLQMPGMDGIEFIRRVAEERLSPSVIVVSGLEAALLSSVETMARGYGIKMLGAIEKPVTAQKLSNLLARHKQGAATVTTPALRFGESEILEALGRGEFVPYFQPKVNFADQRVAGVEALARWRHSRYGVLTPASFLKTVENSAVQTPFTRHILAESFKHFSGWQTSGLDFTLAVNLSLTYLEGERVAEGIIAQARDAGVPCERIVLEITESLATTQYVRVLENLARLRMNGFGISIDDYGTGYSSVQQLSRIPFTELKLDQSFVSGAASKPALRAILESALQLASKLKLNTVAEGIEREEEWLLLKSLGCHAAQGYYISRPLAPEKVAEWVRDWTGSLDGI